MQQVISDSPLGNHFFSDQAGLSGFFSRSPKRTSVLDRVACASVVVSCTLLALQLHLDCEDLMIYILFVMPILQLSLFIVIVKSANRWRSGRSLIRVNRN